MNAGTDFMHNVIHSTRERVEWVADTYEVIATIDQMRGASDDEYRVLHHQYVAAKSAAEDSFKTFLASNYWD